jgi:ribosomal protein S18 acetylase RimI-like enzyme
MKLPSAIRAARSSDLHELLRLVGAYYRFDRIRFERGTIAGALSTLLRRPALGRVWVAQDRERLVAYLVLTFNYDLEFGGREGMITELFVEARWRRLGIGRVLIDLARSFCHNSGIDTLELQVSRDNRKARAFYRSLGFREFDRVVMTIAAAPATPVKRDVRA